MVKRQVFELPVGYLPVTAYQPYHTFTSYQTTYQPVRNLSMSSSKPTSKVYAGTPARRLPPAASKSTKVRMLAEKYKNESFIAENSILICRACVQPMAMKASQIKQHIDTPKHKKNLQLRGHQRLLTECSGSRGRNFNEDLCEVSNLKCGFPLEFSAVHIENDFDNLQAFISADIPLNKLTNKTLKDFLELYTGRTVPTATNLRTSALQESYEKTLDDIRLEIGEGPIWVSVDETTDAEQRCIFET